MGIGQIKLIYEKDRSNWTSEEVAVQHLGYAGLNGNSRVILSSLKKFGLFDAREGRVKVSDLGLRILHPKGDAEYAASISEALERPAIYKAIKAEYPNWELPSDATLKNKLIRDFGFNLSATDFFIKTLRDSVEFAATVAQVAEAFSEKPDLEPAIQATTEPREQASPRQELVPSSTTGYSVSMPNPVVTLTVQRALSATQKERVLRWLDTVVKPWLDFTIPEGEDS